MSFFQLLFQVVSAVLIPLLFHVHLKVILSIYSRNPPWIMTEIAQNLWVSLGRINIFTVLSAPFHEQAMSLHRCRSHLNSFIGIFQFLAKSCCTCFVTLSPISFSPIKKILLVFNFNFQFTQLVYGVTINFCVPLLCPLILLSSLKLLGVFLVKFFRFSSQMIIIVYSAKSQFCCFLSTLYAF